VIRRLRSLDEVRAACGDDDLVMWAAQDLSGGSRAWALGDAVVAGSPNVSRHDRLAVWGEASDAVGLVRHALGELGPSYRPLGEVELMRQVAAKVDGVREAAEFSWMSLSGRVPAAGEEVGWLDGGAAGEVAELLAADAPHSYAVPGAAGVSRWAGVRVDGVLAAVAAALAMRSRGAANELLDLLAADERFPLDRERLEALLADRVSFTGAAADQVEALSQRVGEVVAAYPEAAAYRPGAIL
jgi:HAMP domain-containing protein